MIKCASCNMKLKDFKEFHTFNMCSIFNQFKNLTKKEKEMVKEKLTK